MCVGSPTAGTWSSSQWRPDNEFETDRTTSRRTCRKYQVTDGDKHIGLQCHHDTGLFYSSALNRLLNRLYAVPSRRRTWILAPLRSAAPSG